MAPLRAALVSAVVGGALALCACKQQPQAAPAPSLPARPVPLSPAPPPAGIIHKGVALEKLRQLRPELMAPPEAQSTAP